MRGPTRVEFMPIKHGHVIDISGMEGGTTIHEIGFKPGPARSRSGWLVMLVHEGEYRDTAWPHHKPGVRRIIPKSAAPKKLRGPRT